MSAPTWVQDILLSQNQTLPKQILAENPCAESQKQYISFGLFLNTNWPNT